MRVDMMIRTYKRLPWLLGDQFSGAMGRVESQRVMYHDVTSMVVGLSVWPLGDQYTLGWLGGLFILGGLGAMRPIWKPHSFATRFSTIQCPHYF